MCWLVSQNFYCRAFSFIQYLYLFINLFRAGFILLNSKTKKGERLNDFNRKKYPNENKDDAWGGEGLWRIGHRILGLLVLALGFVNISLGVFLAVLPLPVWIIWYIYFGFLVLTLIGLEIVAMMRYGCSGKRKGTHGGKQKDEFLD